jgi:hypothetical protein
LEEPEVQVAEELPAEFTWSDPLAKSPRNVYEVMPPGMNGWEREFAELLDRDPHQLVEWWHRNPSDKPWSVNVLMSNGKGFYPDFLIGIHGRETEDGTLLADPKERFETTREAPKVLAEHQVYGKVLILAKDGARWMTVGFDETRNKPVLAEEFRLLDTHGFGLAAVRAEVAKDPEGGKLEGTTMATISATKRPALEAIPEHAMVRLLRACPEAGLAVGARGAVVHVHGGGMAYEVEFSAEKGDLCVVTLTAAEVERD